MYPYSVTLFCRFLKLQTGTQGLKENVTITFPFYLWFSFFKNDIFFKFEPITYHKHNYCLI